MCAVDPLTPHPISLSLPRTVSVLDQVSWVKPLMTSLPLSPRCLPGDDRRAQQPAGGHHTQLGYRHTPLWVGEITAPDRERECEVTGRWGSEVSEIICRSRETDNTVRTTGGVRVESEERTIDSPTSEVSDTEGAVVGAQVLQATTTMHEDGPTVSYLKSECSSHQTPEGWVYTLTSSLDSGSGVSLGDVSQDLYVTSGPYYTDGEVQQQHCHPPASHTNTTQRRQDCNNNLQKSRFPVRPKRRDQGHFSIQEHGPVSQPHTKRQHMVFKHNLWKTASNKFFQRRHAFTKAIAKTFTKIKFFYKNYECSGHKSKIKWNNAHINVGDSGSVLCDNEQIMSERQGKGGDMRGGQQRGDHSPAGQGRHWWHANGSNSENGRDDGRRVHHGDATRKSDMHTTISSSNSSLQRSLDIDTIGRRKRTKGVHSLRRSVSIEHDGSDSVYIKTFKYRDKSLNRRAKTDNFSSSSEDPATGLQATLRARRTKPFERKRSSPSRRAESAPRRPAGDQNRSRRRHTKKKTEQSSSSLSSSSSRSGSDTRTNAGSCIWPDAPSRFKRKTRVATDVTHNEAPVPLEDNCKDNTKDFLERLDSVLSDLVENEKKKISKYGHPVVKENRPENELVNVQPRKKHYKKREGTKERLRDVAEHNDNISPSLQQLRETLKMVRVRKRGQSPGDLLERHSQRFTERLPHVPRILKSQRSSQLLTQRCYQPPRRRPPRPRPHVSDYPSDFCSTDEEQVYQGEEESESVDETEPEAREEQCKGGDLEDEEDTCYGSDYQGSQALHPRGPSHDLVHTPQRLLEAADSGDFSVDSAYTGSRGATPESILNPGVKPRRQSSNLTSPLAAAKPRQSRAARRVPQIEPLQQLKRTILTEIRESKLYSDESINSLLEKYRRKCCHLSSTDLDLVTRSVQDDLGVKPRSAQYLYQMFVGGDDDHTETSPSNKGLGEVEDTSLLTLKSTGKTYMCGRRRRETGVPGRPHSSTSRYAHHIHASHLTTHRPRRSQDETEDEVWAREAVAPGLVAQAREEAQQRRDDDPEPDWSHYVAQLCQQFEIKM